MSDQKVRVVIADDDPDYRRLLDRLITAWGYDTVVVPNGYEATQVLLAEPNTSLAVFDWEMPKMDGVAACRYMRQHRSNDDLFIMMVTVREQPENMVEAFNAGVSDMIKKSFHPLELKSRLESARRRIELRNEPAHYEPAHNESTHTVLPHLPDKRIESFAPAAVDGETTLTNWLAPLDLPEDSLVPAFNPRDLRFTNRGSDHELAEAVRRGMFSPQLLDRVLVCPRCEALPSFRHGCPCCGSGRVEQETLIHHFACAWVSSVADFESAEGLSCPKCRAKKLTVGADFEYQRGPLQCLDCQWRPAELEYVGHCLRCNFRFPAHQALIKDLVAYHARRLVPLAQLPAPQ